MLSPQEERQRLVMSSSEFKKICGIIDRELGIKMPQGKKVMVESRLHKRLRILGCKSFSEYIDRLTLGADKAEEMKEFRNLVTTNKTDFFRENNHFEYLSNTLLPQWIINNREPMTLWTCACSSGEEPYTMAIVLEEFRAKHPHFKYRIIATDISTRVLSLAKEGVYSTQDVEVIPKFLQSKYFLRGKGKNAYQFRIKESLRENITFGTFNLMSNRYTTVPGPAHVIFCRNVLIYFDRLRQEEIIKKLLTRLTPDGTLFLGHSESMAGMNIRLKARASSVYQQN